MSVPSSFRAALAQQSFPGIVAFRSLSLAAIEGFGIDRMEKLSQHVDQMDLFSDDQQDWASSIFADAQQLPFDGEGRILLPDSLREHANLDEMVAFVGRGPTFQLWNPQDFQQYQEKARQRLKAQKISLGALRDKGGDV